MESLFESQYTITQEVYGEYFSYFYFKKPTSILGFILSAVAIAAGIWALIIFGPASIVGIAVIAVAIIYIIYITTGYHRTKKLAYKMDLDDNSGKPVEIKIAAAQDVLVSFRVPNGDQNILEYGNLKQVIETKSLFILLSGERQPYVLKKDSFTKGSSEAFGDFIRQKKQ